MLHRNTPDRRQEGNKPAIVILIVRIIISREELEADIQHSGAVPYKETEMRCQRFDGVIPPPPVAIIFKCSKRQQDCIKLQTANDVFTAANLYLRCRLYHGDSLLYLNSFPLHDYLS